MSNHYKRLGRRHAARVLLPLFTSWLVGFGSFTTAQARRPSSSRKRGDELAPQPETRRWLLVMPHPDDALLTSAGVVARLVAEHVPVYVAEMTNGDFSCDRDGLVREGESIAGLRQLGLDESHVYFMGYPDGHLGELGETPLPPVEHREGARCVQDNHTYGARGFHHHDFHTGRFGAPALYTATNAAHDLTALMQKLAPTDVIVTHPMDVHPDHAAVYAFVRRAIDGLAAAPRLHRALVHTGDCWPLGDGVGEPCPAVTIAPDQPMPPLTGTLRDYAPSERMPVRPALTERDPARNPKLRAIAAHASQTRSSYTSYLFGFARADEVFWPETLERGSRGWLPQGELTTTPPIAINTTLAPGDSWSHAHKLPLALQFEAAAGQTSRLTFLDDEGGGRYAIDVDGKNHEAMLWRQTGKAAVLLKRWPLAHDDWRGDGEAMELRVDPRPADGDGVAELTLYDDGLLVGVAVDVHARRSGEHIVYSAPPGGASLPLTLEQPATSPTPAPKSLTPTPPVVGTR